MMHLSKWAVLAIVGAVISAISEVGRVVEKETDDEKETD